MAAPEHNILIHDNEGENSVVIKTNQFWQTGPTLTSAIALMTVSSLVPTYPAFAQTVITATAPSPKPTIGAPIAPGVVKSITVVGNERLEPDTVRSYAELSVGDRYDAVLIDAALKRLYAAELFADATIKVDEGKLTITVRENPVINRIVFEGAKAVKEDKLREEVRLAPRQIYTRSKVRSDVGRMIEVYRRGGRFAATIEPKVILLPQNRVDLVFEIGEGPKSKVRQINFIGNKKFKSGALREQLYTRQARWYRLFTSNDTYDPDRLSADREKIRQFYLTNGYADFRVSSAVAELTADRKNFIITMVVDEGDRYKFGKIDLDSKIRDIKSADYKKIIPIKPGEWFNVKKMQDTVELLTNTAGLFGYAFADVRPKVNRNKEKLTQDVTFEIAEAPRVYVERININGNTRTLDNVIRREFRLAEGDAFNSFKVKRSKERIQSLGYFQDKLEIEQKPGSTPDKVVLEVNVEEKSTGQLNLGAGFSSLESFILNAGIEQRNFMGKGQDLRLNFELSRLRNTVDVSFTDPYAFGKNLAAGVDLYRRSLNNNTLGSSISNNTTNYDQTDLGFGLRAGFPITEYWNYQARYNLAKTSLTYGAIDTTPVSVTDPATGIITTTPRCVFLGTSTPASRSLCEAVGKRTISSLGQSISYNSLNNSQHPTRGQRFIVSTDFAGLGGSVKYIRNVADYNIFYPVYGGFVLRLGIDGGVIKGLGQSVRFNDHFFLGTPQFRGFDYRGVGPVESLRVDTTTAAGVTTQGTAAQSDFLGGKYYYHGTAEMQIPLGSAAGELGLRTSAFVDFGSVWGLDATAPYFPSIVNGVTSQVVSTVLGNSPSPRITAGFGVSWNSPFGPFRIDISKPIKKQPTDRSQTFQFNVGTSF